MMIPFCSLILLQRRCCCYCCCFTMPTSYIYILWYRGNKYYWYRIFYTHISRCSSFKILFICTLEKLRVGLYVHAFTRKRGLYGVGHVPRTTPHTHLTTPETSSLTHNTERRNHQPFTTFHPSDIVQTSPTSLYIHTHKTTNNIIHRMLKLASHKKMCLPSFCPPPFCLPYLSCSTSTCPCLLFAPHGWRKQPSCLLYIILSDWL